MFEMLIISALEGPVHFLAEKRTEAYKWYASGVSEAKNVLGTKYDLQSRALPGLERRGA